MARSTHTATKPGSAAVARRGPGRPADTDSSDTRNRIVECARERFAAEGFEGTTNREIATLAGVSSAALYHYFPSKADLYIAVCESIDESFVRVVGRARERHDDLENRLVALFDEAGRLATENPSTVSFIAGISAVVRRHPEVAGGTGRLTSDFRRLVLGLVETSADKERILRGVAPEAFTDLVTSVLAGLGRLNAKGERERHLAVADAFLRIVRAP